jgi:hypothetical protein
MHASSPTDVRRARWRGQHNGNLHHRLQRQRGAIQYLRPRRVREHRGRQQLRISRGLHRLQRPFGVRCDRDGNTNRDDCARADRDARRHEQSRHRNVHGDAPAEAPMTCGRDRSVGSGRGSNQLGHRCLRSGRTHGGAESGASVSLCERGVAAIAVRGPFGASGRRCGAAQRRDPDARRRECSARRVEGRTQRAADLSSRPSA